MRLRRPRPSLADTAAVERRSTSRFLLLPIVSKSLSEPIRSHKDLDKDSAPLSDKAVKFYDQIAKQLVHQGHVLDLFACAVDHVGVPEMKVAIEKTGGIVVLAESFSHSVFNDSLLRIFQSTDDNLGLSFNPTQLPNVHNALNLQLTSRKHRAVHPPQSPEKPTHPSADNTLKEAPAATIQPQSPRSESNTDTEKDSTTDFVSNDLTHDDQTTKTKLTLEPKAKRTKTDGSSLQTKGNASKAASTRRLKIGKELCGMDFLYCQIKNYVTLTHCP